MMPSWFRTLRNKLVPVEPLQQQIRELDRELKRHKTNVERLEKTLVAQGERTGHDFTAMQKAVAETEKRLSRTLKRQELLLRQLGSVAGQIRPPTSPNARAEKRAPATSIPTAEPVSTLRRMAEVSSDVWVSDTCPVCEGPDATLACQWNKFVLIGGAPDADALYYDYSVCHACGVLSARRRPVGERFRHLIENFVEAAGKEAGATQVTNPLLNPNPLREEDRSQLRAMISKGLFVSDHLGISKRDYLNGALKDRLENSMHVEVLSSLLTLGPTSNVLEIRPRAGSILAALRRYFGVQVHGLPIWESQGFVIKELYDIDSAGVIDFVDFRVPFRDQFDLIICNHMFTHVVRPREFFAEIRSHLKPGGHLYLYGEPEDAEFLVGGQSIIATLNPFHMQAFDQKALVNALAANGFDTVFTTTRSLTILCLSRECKDAVMTPLTQTDRQKRLKAYADARLRALIRLPDDARARTTLDWDQIAVQAVESGIATVDDAGRLRLVKAGR